MGKCKVFKVNFEQVFTGWVASNIKHFLDQN